MVATLMARMRSLWRGTRRRSAVDAEMSEEFRLHMDMRAADLVRAGLSPDEAARQARVEFGSVDHYKDVGAASRGLRRYDELRVSWLDFKLGFRMLARYPGLTVVGGIAMTFAIAIGAAVFEFIAQMLHPTLPLDEGNRIIAIRMWDAAASRGEQRMLHDFVAWRAEVQPLEEISAFRTLDRNLITESGGRGEPVIVAEMSASGFALTRTRPLLGRVLSDADERPGADGVVVIGYDLWQSRFNGDRAVLGRVVRVGSALVTVVGVMPKGFAFPAYHSVWTPLRLNPSDYPVGGGPGLTRVFARLRPGVSMRDAQKELNAIAARRAAEFPETHAHLRPQVIPYAKSFFLMTGLQEWALSSVNLFLAMLMVLVCGNVALLMFARATSRESEIVVRTALGASRARIILQLFAEALVLGGVALVLGLATARIAHARALDILASEAPGRWPFWNHPGLSPVTILYAFGLTLLGAVVAGVLPALKVTRGLDGRLRQAAAGVGSHNFGGIWTTLIAAQIAITVAFPVTAFLTHRDAVHIESLDLGLPAREYLAAQVAMDRDVAPGLGVDTTTAGYRARFRTTALELQRRIEGQAAVSGATFANLLPGMDHPQRDVEVEGVAADSSHSRSVSFVSVTTNYFRVMGARVFAGRSFIAADLESEVHPVVVNQAFVREVLGGRNAIGRRFRYASAPKKSGNITSPPIGRERAGGARRDTTHAEEPWNVIVGVVSNLGMSDGSEPRETGAGVYHLIEPGAVWPLFMAVHARGDARALAPTLRTLSTALDPTLRIDSVLPLNELQNANLRGISFWFRGLVAVSAMALLLSLAAIYAVMAFAVSRRTREIGVRVALGANRTSIVKTIVARPLRQVVIGISAGSVLVALLVYEARDGMSVREGAFVACYALLMMGVCLFACIVPARRALAIEPTEALRADG
jgi:putative ABC transport system permease protein